MYNYFLLPRTVNYEVGSKEKTCWDNKDYIHGPSVPYSLLFIHIFVGLPGNLNEHVIPFMNIEKCGFLL